MTAPHGISRNSNFRAQSRYAEWKDQHGRLWRVNFHPKNMLWTCPPTLRDARPPLDGEQDYVEPMLDDRKEPIAGQLYVNHRKWRQAISTRDAEWKDAMRENAKKMYPSNVGEALRNPPIDLLVETGPGPAPVEIVEAMEAGNKWALGLSTQRPKWVTDDMLDRVAALTRSTGYRESGGRVSDVDATKYLDEEEVFDTAALGGKTIPMKTAKAATR